MAFKLKQSLVASSTHRTCDKCPLEPDCPFGQRRFGGFKGTRAHYIGYRLITDATEGRGAKEDCTTCFNWIESGLHTRMLNGRALRDAGHDGEMIRILGQEGDTFRGRTRVGVNSMGHVVRPNAELLPIIKLAGFKVAENDSAQAVEWKEISYTAKVPNYDEVVGKVEGYRQEVIAAELATQEDYATEEDKAWDAAQKRQAKDRLEPTAQK